MANRRNLGGVPAMGASKTGGSGGSGGTVTTDGVTIQGIGSSGSPIALKAVQTDATLTGNGTVASPLHVASGGSSTLSAAYLLGLAGTPAVDNTFSQNSANVLGAQVNRRKSRGTIGAPTVVTAADYLGIFADLPYTGTEYLNVVSTYTQVTPGATIAAGSVPTDFVIDLFATGVLADPKAAAANAYTIPFRVIAGVGTSAPGTVGGDHWGTVLVNGPSTFTEANTVSVGSLTHETSSLNTFGQAATGFHSFSLLHWRPNSANRYIDNGGLSWAFNGGGGNTAGAEATFFEVTGLFGGASEILFTSQTVTGSGFVNGRGSLRTTYDFSWHNAGEPSIWRTAGAGSKNDVNISRDNTIPGTVAYKFGMDNTDGNFLWIVQGAAGQQAHLALGNNVNAGLWWDPTKGFMYTSTPNTSFVVGPDVVYATTRTFDFLCLPTMAGTPTGVPINFPASKTPIVVDTAVPGIWGYIAGAWTNLTGAGGGGITTLTGGVTATGSGSVAASVTGAVSTRVPFGSATAGTFTSDAAYTYNVGASTLHAPNVVGASDNSGFLGASGNSYAAVWTYTIANAGVPATINLDVGQGITLDSNTTGNVWISHQGTNGRFLGDINGIQFFGGSAPPVGVPQQTGGAATATVVYTATEQGMINRMYTALRNYGLLT